MFWSKRIALARLGWETKLKLSRDGIIPESPTQVALSIWANRWDWQGWVSRVVFHTHDIFDLCGDDAADRVLARLETLREGCERAPHEFPNTVPMQLRGLCPDGRLTFGESYLGSPKADGHARSVFPSELIPRDANLRNFADGRTPLQSLIAIAASGFDVEDRLHHGVGRPRVVRDCEDRRWGYEASVLSPITHTGEDFGPQTWKVDSVYEASASALLDAARSEMTAVEGSRPTRQSWQR